ncbi:Imm26 family immunity protein [Bacillus sp. S13(2024)]|uniref:Imm26 family immunity protein n=1 Tax=unclassified Bacillus (in: firmicutes) TaxID=185979 RepID=UPI003D22D6E8
MTVRLGKIDIFLPDATSSYFFIVEDLAGILKVETNYDALKQFRKILRNEIEKDLYKRIDFGQDSSEVVIRTTNALTILKIAAIINGLINVTISEEGIMEIEQKLLSHKRPKKQKWKVGDIFLLNLSNGTYGFGQILWKPFGSPVCGLFDLNTETIPTVAKISNHPFISVLTLLPSSLDKGDWKVIGNADVRIDIEKVPWQHRGLGDVGSMSCNDGILLKLANAYYGLFPWNVFYEEDYFDKILLSPFKRSNIAKVLSPIEREEYRKEKKWN